MAPVICSHYSWEIFIKKDLLGKSKSFILFKKYIIIYIVSKKEINIIVYTIIDKGEIKMKEMTLKEIQKILGYEVKVVAEKPRKKFNDIKVGEIITVANTDFIVLDKTNDEVICLTKDFVHISTQFDSITNNYAKSSVRVLNRRFAQELIAEVGKKGLRDIKLDLTSLDGLDDYGTIIDKIGLLTVDMYRKYSRVIEKYPVDNYWWLATSWSTPHRGCSSGICVINGSGAMSYCDCGFHFGVRPFCIFSSSIF